MHLFFIKFCHFWKKIRVLVELCASVGSGRQTNFTMWSMQSIAARRNYVQYREETNIEECNNIEWNDPISLLSEPSPERSNGSMERL